MGPGLSPLASQTPKVGGISLDAPIHCW